VVEVSGMLRSIVHRLSVIVSGRLSIPQLAFVSELQAACARATLIARPTASSLEFVVEMEEEGLDPRRARAVVQRRPVLNLSHL
jgi:hypothetical protein